MEAAREQNIAQNHNVQNDIKIFLDKAQQSLNNKEFSTEEFIKKISTNVIIQDVLEISSARRQYRGDKLEINVDLTLEDIGDPALQILHNDSESVGSISNSEGASDYADVIIISDSEDDQINMPDHSVDESPNQMAGDDNVNWMSEFEFPDWVNEQLNTMTFDDKPMTANTRMCTFCMSFEPQVAFIPCGHRCICLRSQQGFDLLKNAVDHEFILKCVLCEREATSMMKIF